MLRIASQHFLLFQDHLFEILLAAAQQNARAQRRLFECRADIRHLFTVSRNAALLYRPARLGAALAKPRRTKQR